MHVKLDEKKKEEEKKMQIQMMRGKMDVLSVK